MSKISISRNVPKHMLLTATGSRIPPTLILPAPLNHRTQNNPHLGEGCLSRVKQMATVLAATFVPQYPRLVPEGAAVAALGVVPANPCALPSAD